VARKAGLQLHSTKTETSGSVSEKPAITVLWRLRSACYPQEATGFLSTPPVPPQEDGARLLISTTTVFRRVKQSHFVQVAKASLECEDLGYISGFQPGAEKPGPLSGTRRWDEPRSDSRILQGRHCTRRDFRPNTSAYAVRAALRRNL
jgi:hypothetical protein